MRARSAWVMRVGVIRAPAGFLEHRRTFFELSGFRVTPFLRTTAPSTHTPSRAASSLRPASRGPPPRACTAIRGRGRGPRKPRSSRRSPSARCSFRWPSAVNLLSWAARCEVATAIGARALRDQNHPPSRLGTEPRPQSDPQVCWRTAPCGQRPAPARALQPTGLRLAHEDQGDAGEGNGACGSR